MRGFAIYKGKAMNSEQFDVSKAPQDALKTESGIEYVLVKKNPEGKSVQPNDWVKVHYTGWTTDGEKFDSSLDAGEPTVFPIDSLIPGMNEALQLARVGEKIRVWIPEELAYQGIQGAPQGTLVFEFEIFDIVTPSIPPFEPGKDAIKLENDLTYEITKRGEGEEELKPTDIVTLDFNGWHVESGERFHSSVEVGESLVGPVQSFFPGFSRVLVHAHKGDELTIWVPQSMGVDPEGKNLKGSLIFTVEILDVRPEPKAIEAPEDVAEPPADAEKTASGLASKVLSAGTGNVHPKATSRVRVHYTGWTTDGAMFDSSVVRGEPIVFGLNQVIPGWTEGVQLMVEGEKRRLWIPERLAYRGMPGAPQGMLVFDVELIAIV